MLYLRVRSRFSVKPLSEIVYFRTRKLSVVWRIRLDVALDSGHELPHAHGVDLLRREADRGSRAIDGGKPDLAIRQVVYGASAT